MFGQTFTETSHETINLYNLFSFTWFPCVYKNPNTSYFCQYAIQPWKKVFHGSYNY